MLYSFKINYTRHGQSEQMTVIAANERCAEMQFFAMAYFGSKIDFVSAEQGEAIEFDGDCLPVVSYTSEGVIAQTDKSGSSRLFNNGTFEKVLCEQTGRYSLIRLCEQ